MGILQELLSTVRSLGALEKRTEDVLANVVRLASKVDSLAERLAHLESDHKHMKDSVRNEIMADIKGDLARTKVLLDLQAQSLTRTSRDA